MPSPSKPSDFSNLVLTSSSTLCDRFKAVLLSLPSKVYDLANYLLDADGNPSKTFAKDLLASTGIWSIGDVKASFGSNTPDGWVECNGESLSRTDYSDLFAVISTTYGAPTDETFNVPDMRGYVAVGRNDSTNLSADSSTVELGGVVGAEEVTLENVNYPDISFSVVGFATAHATAATHRPAVADKERYREALGYCLYHEGGEHTSRDISHDSDGSTMIASTYGEASIPEAEGKPISVMQPSIGVRYLMYTGYYTSI